MAFVQALRTEDLFKKPGVAETIDWAKCLLALDVIALSPEVIADTLGAILKYQDDIQKHPGLRSQAHPRRGPRRTGPGLMLLRFAKYPGGAGAGPRVVAYA